MFGSNILDIAIGLVFLFLLLSLICSAANELLEVMLKKRAKDLEKGIAELLGDPAETKVFLAKIYNHGLINGLYRGDYLTTPKGKLPSYIPSRNFALALISIAEDASNSAIIPKNVRSAFDAFKITASNDAQALQKSVEDWFNSAMDRVSGWYKRRTQILIFLLGVGLAIAVNADCIEFATKLSKDASLRQSVVALAQATAKNDPTKDDTSEPENKIKTAIASLDGIGLPIGWSDYDKQTAPLIRDKVWNHGFGWLLTALAVSLGAPFWFDMLNKLIVVRSTVKPHEKSREESSKDASQKSSPAPPAAAGKTP